MSRGNRVPLPKPPATHVWVEWVGEWSPLDDPTVQYGMIAGWFTEDQKRVIREMARATRRPVGRHIIRAMRKGRGHGQLPGLSVAVIRWGPRENARPGEPGSFIQLLTHHDADLVRSTECGHEFRVRGWESSERDPLVLPFATEMRMRLGRREPLVGVVPNAVKPLVFG